MSKQTNSCSTAQTHLDDFVDERLSEEQREAVAEHIQSCENCRQQVTTLRRLLAATEALPRRIDPSRDLWPELVDRLPAKVPSAAQDGDHRGAQKSFTPPDTGASRFGVPRFGGGLSMGGLSSGGNWWLRQAVAALFFMAVGVALGQWIYNSPGVTGDRANGRSSGNRTAESAEQPGSAEEGADYRVVSENFQLAEADCLRTKEALWLAYRRQDIPADLSPVTLRVVERNLRIIDQATQELQEALAKDPGNPDLENLVLANHRRSIELLERMTEGIRET